MEAKSAIVGAVVMLLALGAVGGAAHASGALADAPEANTSVEEPEQTETQESVNEDEVNEQAQKSIDGAHALKSALGDSEYSDARVFVKKDGTLMVSPDAAAAHGSGNLKDNAYEQTFHWTSPKEGSE